MSSYLTGVVAPEPEPARDGDASSALGGVACDTNHASTTCLVAFLSTIGTFTSLNTSTKQVKDHFMLVIIALMHRSMRKVL